MMSEQLEQLYQEARTALKAKDYTRASDLLRQILQIDENYKDASRLLALTVKLRRRRWYNHPLLWGGLGLAVFIGLGIWLAPRLGSLVARQISTPTSIQAATITQIPTKKPSLIPLLSSTPSPSPTPIPLAWKRLYTGAMFSRDTITAIAEDSRDPNVIYAGTQNAGIYKTIDGGSSWKPIHKGLMSANVSALIIDFQDPAVLYAVLSSGLHKTRDGGEHWELINAETFIQAIAMDPQDDQHLYFSYFNNLAETKDGGDTWTPVQASRCPDLISALEIDPRDSQVMFAVDGGGNSACPGGVYKSTNGGTTWSITGLEVAELTGGFDLVGDFIYVLSGREAKVSVSSDEGLTWAVPVNPEGNRCIELAVDPTDGNNAYCAVEAQLGNFILATSTAGRSWHRISIPDIGEVRTIKVSSQSSQTIFIGGQGLAISTDNGASWEEKQDGLGGRFNEIKLDPLDSSTFYAYEGPCNFGGVYPLYQSIDGAVTWKVISNAQSDKRCGLSLDADGNMYRYMWWRLTSSRDQGQNWVEKETTSPRSFITGLAANPHLSGVLLAQMYDARSFYQSKDGGQSWMSTTTSNKGDMNYFFFDHDQGQVVYAVSRQSIYHSSDGGTKWSDCPGSNFEPALTDSSLAIDFQNSTRLFIGTRGGGIFSSTDGCQSWKSSNTGLGNTFINSIAIDPNNPDTLYAGTDGGAYISFNSGGNWAQINDGLLGATVVYSIVVDKDSHVYASTPYGIFQLESK